MTAALSLAYCLGYASNEQFLCRKLTVGTDEYGNDATAQRVAAIVTTFFN